MKLMFVAFYSYLVVVAVRLAVWTIGGLVATNGSLPWGHLKVSVQRSRDLSSLRAVAATSIRSPDANHMVKSSVVFARSFAAASASLEKARHHGIKSIGGCCI